METSSVDAVISILDKYKCRIIGITTNATNIYQVSAFSKSIKQKRRNIRVVMGGPQGSFDDIRVMKDSDCDVVIRHEGDIKLVQIIQHLQGEFSLSKIKGVTYRDGDMLLRNPDEKEWIDINTLPTPLYAIVKQPEYWILPVGKNIQEKHAFFSELTYANNYFMASRGCPYHCSFCVEGILSNNYRERSAELVYVDLISFLDVFQTNVVFMADSTLTSSVKRVREICSIFRKIRNKRKVWWYAEGRVNILYKNLYLIKEMKEAGLLNLQIGIETGNDGIMRLIHKGITKEQIKAVAKEVGKLENLLLVGNIIFGLPGETRETFQESLSFAQELQDLSDCSMLIASSYFVPFVGTEIRNNLSNYPLTILQNDFETEEINGFEGPICLPNAIPLEEFELYKPIFDLQIKQFVTHKIITSSKRVIDKKMEFVMNLASNGINIANHWSSVLFKNIFFQKYYSCKAQKDTVSPQSTQELATAYPFRLWDLDFDDNIKGYRFVSLRGEKIELSGELRTLWEFASGKLNIQTICESLYPDHPNPNEQLEKVCCLYRKLYDSFAIIFKKPLCLE